MNTVTRKSVRRKISTEKIIPLQVRNPRHFSQTHRPVS